MASYRVMTNCPEGYSNGERRYLRVTREICASLDDAYRKAAAIPDAYVVSDRVYQMLDTFTTRRIG